MIELSAIRDRHKGQTAAVLGGAASLVADIERIPADVTLIGCNHHSALLALDYAVAIDPEPLLVLRRTPVKVISPSRAVEPDIWATNAPNFGFTGPFGVWVAQQLGFSRVIVAGMDNYQGQRRYWYEVGDYQPIPESSDVEMKSWSLAKRHLPRPDEVEVLSGPLQRLFRPC